MTTAKISGFKIPHSASSCFDTVIKLPPKNTPRTPSMRNNSLAVQQLKKTDSIFVFYLTKWNYFSGIKCNLPKGLCWAASKFGKSIVLPFPSTSTPGMNFKLSGFGVSCVWMNIVRTHWKFTAVARLAKRDLLVVDEHTSLHLSALLVFWSVLWVKKNSYVKK